jgi:ribonucleoside-diphosphate reductase alpha chain
MPADCTVEDVEEAYKFAWEQGLKSIAIYRDGSKEMQPLREVVKDLVAEIEGPQADPTIEVPIEDFQWSAVRRKLPPTRESMTHSFNIGGFEGYLTVGLYEDGDPGEIFINMQKQGSTINGLMDSFAICLSFALQYGVPLAKLIEKFKGTRFEPSGITDNEDLRMTTSIMDYIFRWLAAEFLDSDDDYEESQTLVSIIPQEAPAHLDASGPLCLECGHPTIMNGRCFQCFNCGATTGCS